MVTPNGWRVTGQHHTETYLANGRFEGVMRVDVVTDAGTTKTFTIPDSQYTADNVTAEVNAWVEHENAVGQLGNKG